MAATQRGQVAIGAGGMALGSLLGAGSSWLQGNAANLARRRLESAANLPGLDIDKLTTEGLNSLYSQIPNAARSTNLINQTNLDQLNRMWGQIPGANQMMAQQSSNINDWLQGNLSKEISDMVHRNAAVRSIGGGYGGSGMMRNLLARDLGTTSLGLQQAAMPMANQFASTTFATRFPQLASIQQYTVNPNQWLGIRERERAAQQQLLAQLAGMPGKTAVWGQYFGKEADKWNSLGSSMLGMGMGGGAGG